VSILPAPVRRESEGCWKTGRGTAEGRNNGNVKRVNIDSADGGPKLPDTATAACFWNCNGNTNQSRQSAVLRNLAERVFPKLLQLRYQAVSVLQSVESMFPRF
jgi:hypothetical protein